MQADCFSIDIQTLSFGGKGIGRRSDGKVVFVPSVMPGESVQVRTEKEHASYIEASLVGVDRPSPQRRRPQCPFFEDCGGCDWQHIPYDMQLESKTAILVSELKKQGCDIPHLEVCRSPQEFAYRGHARLQCEVSEGVQIGFFMKKTNTVIDVEHCPVMNPRIQSIYLEIRERLKWRPIRGLYSLDIHSPADETLVMGRCRGTLHGSDFETINSLYNELDIAGAAFIYPGQRKKAYSLGQDYCRYQINTPHGKLTLSTGMGGFIQANMDVNNAMVNHIIDLAVGEPRILDLYSGSGNIGIPLAASGAEVTAIERDRRLAAQGKSNARKNQTTGIRFMPIDVRKALQSISNEKLEFDTVILDPPREGAKGLAPGIAATGAQRVIYVSCNPATLSRDLKALGNHGYHIKDIRLFDMFPQTYHIESVSLLQKG